MVVRHVATLAQLRPHVKTARDRRAIRCDHSAGKEAAMDGPHLIYFSDPMCSWCYGFSPVIEEIRHAYGNALPIRIVMGGLRPGTTTPMTQKARAEILTHWNHVHEASGLPFDAAVLDREGFVYDTDPAARAVVVVRRQGEDVATRFLAAAQRAFYAEARDITQGETLADLAADFGLDREAFLADWSTEEAKQETWRDYAVSQRAGVTGFPTLVGGPDAQGVYGVVTRGYAPPEQVLAVLRDWISGIAA
jgi:putative protein-disulfide isomerase